MARLIVAVRPQPRYTEAVLNQDNGVGRRGKTGQGRTSAQRRGQRCRAPAIFFVPATEAVVCSADLALSDPGRFDVDLLLFERSSGINPDDEKLGCRIQGRPALGAAQRHFAIRLPVCHFLRGRAVLCPRRC